VRLARQDIWQIITPADKPVGEEGWYHHGTLYHETSLADGILSHGYIDVRFNTISTKVDDLEAASFIDFPFWKILQ